MTQSPITTINPATGETLDTYPYMSHQQVVSVVKGCHEAFLGWRQTSLEERADHMRAIARELRNSKDEFAELMSREVGKLIGDSRQEVELCAQICEYTADKGIEELADQERKVEGFSRGIITFSPLGVIYGIQPWNFPCYQVVRYSIANLMAGNGVLIKHAPNCTGSGVYLRKLYQRAGLPEGLFAQLVIDHDQSDEVIKDDLVRGVTMTGSASAGRTIAQKAAASLKKSVLELGSNDAYLVLEDADLETAIKVCTQGRLVNNGETCISAKRMVVTEAHYNRFLEGYVESMRQIKTGDPFDESTDLGPLARQDLREKLHDQVQESVNKGARVLCGGQIPEGPGFFYPSTVLSSVEPGQPAYDDELFGPVASVIKARDDQDAMRIANDSRFGLGGGIISQDEDRAIALARDHFDTGMVFINGYRLASPNMPFGGVKDSGYGREHGGFGMKEFVNVKSIFVS
jgi:succinate-semialdehyde dehydrogenase/glutarate-semialdehyde dehydrogenase